MLDPTIVFGLTSYKPDVAFQVHHPTNKPSRPDWDNFCKFCRSVVKAAATSSGVATIVVFTDGPAPDAAQRKQLSQEVAAAGAGVKIQAALVSGSVLTRGIATAFTWLGVPVRAFDPARWREALAYARVETPHEIDELRGKVREAMRQLQAQPISAERFLLDT
jgi:hypothetical protein